MSEIDDFLKWGAHAGEKGEKNEFGKPLGQFPYGTFSYWISEYKRSKTTLHHKNVFDKED